MRAPPARSLVTASLALTLALSSCTSEPIEVRPPAPTLQRLTRSQYRNSVVDLLGDGLVVPDQLEPDIELFGFHTVGASAATISPRGVEQYETAAYSLAGQALTPEYRDRLVSCTPGGNQDSDCSRETLERFAQRAWRRPLSTEELDQLVGLADAAGGTLGDFYAGIEFGVAAILQSPNFLFRAELGEVDPEDPTQRRFTDWELAARLSFFLWNTTPDDALLAAAEAGELTTPEGLANQANRLLSDPRARNGMRNFFHELMTLYRLDDLNQDPTVFTHMSAAVGPSAREELLTLFEDLVFDQDGDYTDLFVTRKAYVDRTLAAIYNLRAPARDGFGFTEHPEDGTRRGMLGKVAILAQFSHPTHSSATLRGQFVRETILCEEAPPPPAGVDTSIPEPSGTTLTLRDRVAEHLENEFCASCHLAFDPIGLGLENFDGLGRWRVLDHGAVVDPSGDLDGAPFADAWEMTEVLADDPRIGPCFARNMYRYAMGHGESRGELDAVDELGRLFVESGHSVQQLALDIVMSEAFRVVGEVE